MAKKNRRQKQRASEQAAAAASSPAKPRRAVPEFVARPFEGLTGEADWVAMREIVPAATAKVRTTAEYGSRDVVVATLLPMLWPALHREDGTVLVATQTTSSSGDASRDVAAALLQALEAEPGTAIPPGELPEPGPRLQDVLEDGPFAVELSETFDFWLSPQDEHDHEIEESLENANDAIVPTVAVEGVDAAYWCRMNGREFLRWVVPQEEDRMLDALARLHADRAAGLDDDARLVGAFRTCGVLVPVWELARGTEADELTAPLQAFAGRLEAALADEEPLTPEQRRARAGLVSRQVNLR
ncbi:conserved hypothetical protein [Beutenbergia cavernae DSM 12333]|uniref:DUF5926 domain-containing protein n=1 Tax=Beutenbergia cavernae (strain ATCC BAA-8 / DSM 12333 / CCUG 43141 / JCM 11478 / NBRC 16432 / NCIMB 13614 / HKI 0122) TaxID=471853 RepID=C5BWI0_BEUC1|nr:DUF5926 family protein [Beutenbergia cavernae]ACQ78638.1 conserved hypothetical protein [Beutenbergia cavernae DSM 12333]